MSGKGLDSMSKRGKSRLQDYLDSQAAINDEMYDDDDAILDNTENRGRIIKLNNEKDKHLRIASSGRNHSDKEIPSEKNEMISMDDRSFDPDHEPRKEGTIKIKHSPSIAEILPTNEGMSEGASLSAPGDRKAPRGSQSRSPGRVMNQITDIDEDSNKNYRSLNSDNKGNQKSQRKIKPIQYGMPN